MFSNLTVGIIMGIGVAGWVYSKIYKRTGGNTQNSLVVAVLVGLLAAMVVVVILGMFL